MLYISIEAYNCPVSIVAKLLPKYERARQTKIMTNRQTNKQTERLTPRKKEDRRKPAIKIQIENA